MLEFAVRVEGETEEGKAYWVLAVDPVGERLLIAHQDGSLHWQPQALCSFVKMISPERPRPVIAVQPQQGPQIVMPNRAERRRVERNGG